MDDLALTYLRRRELVREPNWPFGEACQGSSRASGAARVSLLCEASLTVQSPWMAAACRAGMKEPAEKTSWPCAELLEFAP